MADALRIDVGYRRGKGIQMLEVFEAAARCSPCGERPIRFPIMLSRLRKVQHCLPVGRWHAGRPAGPVASPLLAAER